MTADQAADLLRKGWGSCLDIRRRVEGHDALIQFADEEAPRWISYTALAAHRRQLLFLKRQLLTS